MSIVNAFIQPDRALVGVDTEASLIGANRTFAQVSKLIPLAHLHAVFAFRGVVCVGMAAWVNLNCSNLDFDALKEHAPIALKAAVNSSCLLSTHLGVSTDELAKFECVLVGLSRKSGNIVGYHFAQEEKDSGFMTYENFAGCYGPDWKDGELDPPKLNITPDKTGMINLSLRQANLLRKREGDTVAAGGGLIVAEIDRHRITIERLVSFPSRLSD